MSWAIGEFNGRDIGYGVPAICDHPCCGASIDRGLAYVCGSEPYGGEHGCGLFFCEQHRSVSEKDDVHGEFCARCLAGEEPFGETPDTAEWIQHKETDESWAQWRAERDARAPRRETGA